MLLEQERMPQFREADERGTIGLRGYMGYLQDMTTEYLHRLGKGNDTLPEEYGMYWLYTKYRLVLLREADFSAPLALASWLEPGKSRLLVHLGVSMAQNGVPCAQGRLECCVYRLDTETLVRPSAIDFPSAEAAEPYRAEVPAFTRMPLGVPDPEKEGFSLRYIRRVRYTDLDKGRHMNNTQYVLTLLDAFDGAFYALNRVTGFEIHYLNQCREGENITVFCRQEPGVQHLLGLRPDGTAAVRGILWTEER